MTLAGVINQREKGHGSIPQACNRGFIFCYYFYQFPLLVYFTHRRQTNRHNPVIFIISKCQENPEALTDQPICMARPVRIFLSFYQFQQLIRLLTASSSRVWGGMSSITGVLQPLYRDHKRKNSVTELGSVTVYFLSNYYFMKSTPPSREGVQGDPILS